MDEIRFDAAMVRAFIACGRAIGWVVAAISLAVLATWIAGAGPLRAFVQSSVSMHAGAALACLLASAALLLGSRAPRSSVALSLLAALVGGVELWNAAFHPDGRPWHWIARSLPRWPERPSGEMTELAALGFVLLGGAGAATAAARAVWLREACTLAAIAIAMASCASYGLVLAGDDASLLRRLPITTASSLLALALGWMASTPTRGLTRIAVAQSLGGALGRRLILPALLLPVALTFVFKVAQSEFGMPESLALALAAVATGGTVAAMVVWVAFLLDRSERQRRTVVALREDASTDALTGLANRRVFDAALTASLGDRDMASTALLMVDIDHFKRFNDSFGHQAGDEVLRETGRLLHAAVRSRDLVARYGGEEFAVLLPRADARRAEQIGQRILAAFRSHPWTLRPVTVSIGGAVAAPGDTPSALLRCADEALYRSKQQGRDRCTF